jgi:uncharacterized membrane protein
MPTCVSRFIRNIGGNFSTMTALAFPVLLLGVGLTLDAATLYVQKRDLQGIIDIAAITAAANIDKAAQAAALTLNDNGIDGVQIVDAATATTMRDTGSLTDTLLVEPGLYSADGTKTLAQRFTAGAIPTNAVKVTVRTKGDTYFPQTIFADTMLGASAIATIQPEASFQVGTRLASVKTNESIILNALLGELLGTKLNLSLMDYEKLLGTKVDAFKFLDALATELNLTAASYQQVLNTQANIGHLLRATASIDGLDLATKTLVWKIVAALPATKNSVPLNNLLGLGKAGTASVGSSPYGRPPNGASPTVGLLDLIKASIGISNGRKQVSTNVGVNLPGLATITVDLAIGEPPQGSQWLKMGSVESYVYTAQTRLKVSVDLLEKLDILGIKASVRIPLFLNLGAAHAELTQLSCSSNDITTVNATINTTPAVADLWVAEVNKTQMENFNSTPDVPAATLVNISVSPLGLLNIPVKIKLGARATVGNKTATPLRFTYADIQNQTIKTAFVQNYTTTLVSSLLTKPNLAVELPLGINLNLGNALGLLGGLLSGITKPLDDLLFGLLSALGVKLGSADVWMNGATCGKAVLVQ